MSGIAIFIGCVLADRVAARCGLAVSGYRIGAAKPFDHRDAQQIGAQLVAVGGDGAQLVVELLALARVLLLDVALVLDGLALEILLRDGAALAVVEVEQILARAVLDDRRELVGRD